MNQDRPAELYRRFGPAVYSRCKRLLRDPALAEDATQEVFVRVLRHLDQAPDDEAALAWIYRISTNYCLNLLRDRGSQAEPVGELPDRAGDSPEAALVDRQTCLRLLTGTPEKLREPAALYWIDGMEQGQIAQTLGVSRRTVLYRLAEFLERARRTLAGGAS